jgi:hypothetical protein
VIVRVTYFKSSGKYYTHDDWEVDDHLLHNHVVAKLRGLAFNGGRGAMPGIAGSGWDGYAVLQIGDVPHLLDLRGSREVE